MDFSSALLEIKAGKKVTRRGWPEGGFIFLVPGSTFTVNRFPLNTIMAEGTEVNYCPHIDICLDNNVSVWDACTADMLSDDWELF